MAEEYYEAKTETALPPDFLFQDPTDPFATEEGEVKKAAERSKESRQHEADLQNRLEKLTNMFHPPGGDQKAETIRDEVKNGKISPSDFFRMTGRIYGGAPQAKPTDEGTPGLDRLHHLQTSGMPLPATPGLDNLHRIQPPAAVIPGTPPGATAAPPREIFGSIGMTQPGRTFQTDYGRIGVTGGPLNPGGKISNNGAGLITQSSS